MDIYSYLVFIFVAYLAVINLTGFIIMGVDKSSRRR